MEQKDLHFMLGHINAKLEDITKDMCDIKKDVREVKDRLRKVEIKAFSIGSLSAGLTILAAHLKTKLGM